MGSTNITRHTIWEPADFQAVLDLATQYPAEVGESAILAELVERETR